MYNIKVDKRENMRFFAGTVFISSDRVPGGGYCKSSCTITVDGSQGSFCVTVYNTNKIQTKQ
jgi:hypothetical protein